MNKKSIKNTFFIFIAIFLLSMAMVGFLFTYFNKTKINAYADAEESINFNAPSLYENNIVTNVVKVKKEDGEYKFVLGDDNKPIVVRNNEFVFLKSNEYLFITFSKHGSLNSGENPALKALSDEIDYNNTKSNLSGYNYLTSSNIELAYLDVQASLNNTELNVASFIIDGNTITSKQNLSGTSTKYEFGYIISGSDLISNYGKYDFKFNYMTRETQSVFGDDVSNISTSNITIFAFEQSYYYDSKPMLKNYSNIGISNPTYDGSYLFNFNNSGLVGENLVFPNYVFDSTKFVLNYSRIYSGKTDNFNNVGFDYSGNNKKIIFNELGDYEISKQIIYTLGNEVYVCNNTTSNNLLKFKSDKLYIYGYQAYYSALNSGRKDKFYKENLETDLTNKVQLLTRGDIRKSLIISVTDEELQEEINNNYYSIKYNTEDKYIVNNSQFLIEEEIKNNLANKLDKDVLDITNEELQEEINSNYFSIIYNEENKYISNDTKLLTKEDIKEIFTDTVTEKNLNKNIEENYFSVKYNSEERFIEINSRFLSENIQSTNLAPVWFEYYANYTENSKIFFKSSDVNSSGNFEEINFENQKLSNNGRYVIYIEYNFDTSENVKYQIFSFDIKNATPEIMLTYNDDENKKFNISSNSFTKYNVELNYIKNSVFDSDIKISYIKNSLGVDSFSSQYTSINDNNGAYNIVFSENGNYKILVEYGYNFLQSYEIYFTIDSCPITNVKSYGVVNTTDSSGNNIQIRDTNIDLTDTYLVCSPFVLQWDLKESKANINVYLKYIPFISDSSNITSIKDIEDYYIISSGYKTTSLNKEEFDYYEYSNEKQYINGKQSSSRYITVDSKSVLSNNGIYMFYIEDEAGNYTYYSKILDTTKANVEVYTKSSDTFVLDSYIQGSTNYQVVSEDKKYIFGTHKSIKIDKSILNDSWFKKVYLLDQDLYNNNYSGIYFNDETYNLILVPIQTVDIVSKASGTKTVDGKIENQEDILKHINISKVSIDEYSYTLSADNGERTYSFYINDKSNSQYKYSTNSLEFTIDGGNTRIFRVEVNFDKSQGTILHNDTIIQSNISQEQENEYLNKRLNKNYTSSNIENSIYTYYYGTKKNVIQFLYKDQINIGGKILRVDSVVYNYYNFIFDDERKTYYYSENPVIISGGYSGTVEDSSYRMGDYIISNIINQEPYVINNSIQGIRTRPGKYEIIRKYNSEDLNIISEKDSLIRVYTFYVDENGIVSSPNFNENGEISYREVGDNINLTLGSSTKISFKEFQKINNNISTDKYFNILSTNYLPVETFIPVAKYGYINNNVFTNNNLNIVSGLSLTYNELNELVNTVYLSDLYSYNLSVKIEFTSESLSSEEVMKKFYRSKLNLNSISEKDTKGFLKLYETDSVGNIINTVSNNIFNKAGTYKIRIYDFLGDYNENNNNFDINSNELCFSFTIDSNSPSGSFYELKENEIYNEISTITNLNYTNYTSFRYQFVDPDDVYRAKIDLNNVYYKIQGIDSTYKKVAVQTSSSNSKLHYFDIFVDTNYTKEPISVYVKVQYEGNKEDYKDNQGNYFFEGESCILVDLKAPEYNINKIINADTFIKTISNLKYTRDIGDRYNVSTLDSSSFFYEYAFIVNKDFKFSRPTNIYSDAYKLYIRKYNKYEYDENGVLQKEYLSPTNPNSGSSNLFNPNLNSDDGTGLAYWREASEDLYNGKVSLYDFAKIWWAGDVNSYYEIVEMDKASNITIYTVYLTEENIEVKLTKGQLDNLTSNVVLTKENNNTEIFGINTIKFDLENPININTDKWYVVTINVNKNEYKFYHTPKLNNLEFYDSGFNIVTIENVNSYFVKNSNVNVTISNRLGNNFSFKTFIVDSNLEFVIKGFSVEENKIVLTADKTQFIKLKNIEFYLRENNIWNKVDFKELSTDSEYIYKSTIDGQENQVYKVVILDVFDRIQEIPYIYGENIISKKFVYEYEDNTSYIYKDINYNLSSGDIYLIYNENYYSNEDGILLYKQNINGEWEKVNCSVSSYFENGIILPGVKKLVIEKPKVENKVTTTGGLYKYKLSLINCLGEKEEDKYFMIYNRLPNISITDDNNNDKSNIISFSNDISSQSTSKSVYISYKNIVSDLDVYFKTLVTIKAPNGDGELEDVVLEENKIENFSYKGTYFIIINIEGLNFGRTNTFNSATFTISENETNMYDVYAFDDNDSMTDKQKLSSLSDKYTYNDKNINHYITNKNYHKISLNAEKGLSLTKVKTETLGEVVTSIYKIYSNYYETFIAVTYIPKSNNILDNNFDYTTISQSIEMVSGTRFTSNSITLSGKTPNFVKNIEEETNLIDDADTIYLHFPKYFLTPSNKISVKVYCNDILQDVSVQDSSNLNRYEIAISQTGIYTFEFEDQAGNKHIFNNTSQSENNDKYVYTIRFFNDVIVKVNNESALPYKIFNGNVILEIDNDFYKIYNTNPKPEFKIFRNGVELTTEQLATSLQLANNLENKMLNNSCVVLSEIGYYEFYVTASITLNGKLYTLDTKTYTVLIVDEEESRRAFEFVSLENYEITKVVKDNVDVTSNYLVNGKITNFYTYLSTEDETNKGNYELTFKYLGTSTVKEQTFVVKFKINTSTPVIISSIDKGSTTTNKITISFNAKNLYNELGSCKVVIQSGGINYGNYVINKDTIGSMGLVNLELTASGTYYIQVMTASGDIVDSFKVVKKEPLNTVAILLIVGGCLLVVGGGLLFYFLRRRMRVK